MDSSKRRSRLLRVRKEAIAHKRAASFHRRQMKLKWREFERLCKEYGIEYVQGEAPKEEHGRNNQASA